MTHSATPRSAARARICRHFRTEFGRVQVAVGIDKQPSRHDARRDARQRKACYCDLLTRHPLPEVFPMRRPAFYSRSPRTLPRAAELRPPTRPCRLPRAEAHAAQPPPNRPSRAGSPAGAASRSWWCSAPRWSPAAPHGGRATGQGAHAERHRRGRAAHAADPPLPSPAAKAADIIRPSVVRVVGYGPEKATPEAKTQKRGRNIAKGKPPEAR
jgi:hypothetical protein